MADGAMRRVVRHKSNNFKRDDFLRCYTGSPNLMCHDVNVPLRNSISIGTYLADSCHFLASYQISSSYQNMVAMSSTFEIDPSNPVDSPNPCLELHTVPILAKPEKKDQTS